MTSTAQVSSTPNRGTTIFILITAFLNLAGIGIINPVAPFVVGQFVAPEDTAFTVALLFTSYSLLQFIAVPTLGALSDRYGRRPILLISLLGSALGYALYGVGGALWMLFVGRIIDGVTGGNIAIINAYAADISRPAERTKFFGVLGAAAGLGLVIGPALGGLIFRVTGSYAAPLYFAALVTLLNTVWGYFAMPESLPMEKRDRQMTLRRLNPLWQLKDVFSIAHLRLILGSIFIWSIAYAVIQSNFSVFAEDRLGWTPDGIGMGFLIFGVVSIITQTAIIRRLLPLFGEGRLSMIGMVIMIAGFLLVAGVAWTGSLALVIAAIVVTSVGGALSTPALNGLVSHAVGESDQGRAQGGSQSLQALARVVGPLFAGTVYSQVGPSAPYLIGAAGLVLAIFLIAVPTLTARQVSAEAG